MVKFEKIRYKNFLSAGNSWTEINLNTGNKTLILGENGGGKSTIIDALCFALFGKSYRNISKPLLVNSVNDRQMVVEIEFQNNGASYKIIRGMKPNIFEVYTNGVLLQQNAKTKDYQDYVEKNILGSNFRSFTQTDVLGSSNYIPFMRLPLAARREIIENLLDINIFSKMNILLKQRLDTNKETIAEIEKKIVIEQEKMKIQKDNLSKTKEAHQAKIRRLKEEIRQLRIDLKSIEEEIGQLQEQHQNESKVLEKFENVETTEKKIDNLIFQVDKNRQGLKKRLSFFASNEHCPTCTQQLDKSFVDKKLAELETQEKELAEKASGLAEKAALLRERIKTYREINTKLSGINQDILANNIKQREKNNVLQMLIEQYKETMEEFVDSNMENTIHEIQEALETLETSKEEEINKRKILMYSASMLKDTGIKTKIIQQYIPIINESISNYLQNMDFHVSFELNENFEEKIRSRATDDFSYWNFSEGERQRIDLAILFTFRKIAKIKNSISTNLLFLDEIFDSSLDNNGTEDLLSILDSLTGNSIFVISHKSDHLIDKFENILRFKKINGFSVKE